MKRRNVSVKTRIAGARNYKLGRLIGIANHLSKMADEKHLFPGEIETILDLSKQVRSFASIFRENSCFAISDEV